MESSAATLRLAVLPRAGIVTDAILVTGGAGLVALAAQLSFHLGFTPVPITGLAENMSHTCWASRPMRRAKVSDSPTETL